MNLENLGQVEEDTIDPGTGIIAGELSFHYHFKKLVGGARRETPVQGEQIEDESFLKTSSPSATTQNQDKIKETASENDSIAKYLEYCRELIEKQKILEKK